MGWGALTIVVPIWRKCGGAEVNCQGSCGGSMWDLIGAVLWVLWLERQKLSFEGGTCQSGRSLGAHIIAFFNNWIGLDRVPGSVVPTNVEGLALELEWRGVHLSV
jgi:hypothetical protein